MSAERALADLDGDRSERPPPALGVYRHVRPLAGLGRGYPALRCGFLTADIRLLCCIIASVLAGARCLGSKIEKEAQISLRPLFSAKPMPTVLELHLSPETKPIALIVTLTDAIIERLRIEGHTVWPRVGCAKRDLRSEAIGCGGH